MNNSGILTFVILPFNCIFVLEKYNLLFLNMNYKCIVMIRTFTNRNVQPFTEIKPFPSIKHACSSPVWFQDFCYEAHFLFEKSINSPAFFNK